MDSEDTTKIGWEQFVSSRRLVQSMNNAAAVLRVGSMDFVLRRDFDIDIVGNKEKNRNVKSDL